MKRIVIIWVIILTLCSIALSIHDPNSIADPNEIKLPEGVKMPVRLKCPVHGIIGKAFIVIETDNGPKLYCGQCAKTLVARIFDENLPKLEILK